MYIITNVKVGNYNIEKQFQLEKLFNALNVSPTRSFSRVEQDPVQILASSQEQSNSTFKSNVL